MKHVIFALVLTALAASPCFASPTAGQQAQPSAKEKFEKMDANKDGNVTWEEFKAVYPQMQRQAFDAIDVNKDNHLTLEEWLAFVGRHNDGMKQNGSSGPMGGQGMPGGMPPKGESGGRVLITPPGK